MTQINHAVAQQQTAPNWNELNVMFQETHAILKANSTLVITALNAAKEKQAKGDVSEEAFRDKMLLIGDAGQIISDQSAELKEIMSLLKGNKQVDANDYQEFYNVSVRLMNVSTELSKIKIDDLVIE